MKLTTLITTLTLGFVVFKVVQRKRCRKRMELIMDKLQNFEMEVTEGDLVLSQSPTPPPTPVQESLLCSTVSSFEKID